MIDWLGAVVSWIPSWLKVLLYIGPWVVGFLLLNPQIEEKKQWRGWKDFEDYD